MASLKVLSAPANQPTLNPKVVTNPIQPKLNPKVVTKPVQPTLAPKVVTNPVQPSFNPQVQQPAFQPDILVDNSPRFIRLGQRVKEVYPGVYDELDDGQLGKIVATKYPGVYDQLIEPAFSETSIPEPEGTKGLKGVGLGFVKEVGQRLNTISSLGQKAIGKITGIKQPIAQIDKDLLEQKGTAEKIGGGIEQVTEFFIPGGAISKGSKAIESAKAISNLPKTIQAAIKLGGRVTLEAVAAGGVTAIQGGDKKDIKTAAVLGGSFAVIGKGIEKIINKIPDTAWSSILKRTPVDAAKNPNLPTQAAQTGLTGFTRQSLADKASKAIQAIEVSLDDVLSSSKKTINTAKVAGYLGDLRSAYANIPGEQAAVKTIDDIAGQLFESFKKGKGMTPIQANQLKRDIYGMIAKSYGKGMLEIPAKTEAQKAIAAGLKREIEAVIPEAKSLNAKQAIYIQIKKALDKTIARTEGKGIAGTGVGLQDVLIGGLGTGAGALAGNPLLGVAAVITKKTAESPMVLSGTSKLISYFNQLSPTKKLLFYEALKGLTVKSGVGINKAISPQSE